jgi:drug/metabolite transporter (DMT)-like permease
MNNYQKRANALLLLTAAIWGFAFVAQRAGMDHAGPFTFGAIRFLLGALSLVPLIAVRARRRPPAANRAFPNLAAASLKAGCVLFVATGFQQLGLYWTTAGNSGFITGVYVVLVPIAGIFLGRKTGLATWAGAALAFAGLFLVSGAAAGLGAGKALNTGDALTLVSGVFWTVHVLLIDRLVKKTDAVRLSCGQFFVCGALSLAAAACNIPARVGMGTPPELFTAGFQAAALSGAALPILYGGICSAGIAYTLQVVAQQWAHPAHASIILCLESVFAAAGGIVLLGEKPSAMTLAGFALMLGGMLASQMSRPASPQGNAD